MDFFTKIDIPTTDFKIDYTSHLAFFGSCFADNISALFAERKFNTLANPFGTVYNPVSLANQMRTIAEGKVFGEEDIFQGTRCDCLWHCWQAHSSLSGHTREECTEKLNTAVSQARDFLQKTSTVFITFGTAFVYYLKDNGKPVSNCHRQDPNLFTRRMISIDEATEAIREIVTSIRQLNQNAHTVFTVSPLRHLSDGAHNNTLSKATLQLAINSTPEKTDAEYFPSYEIVMDELRDYRFYDSDMIHLSKTAEEHIFERMISVYCDDRTRENISKIETFMKMANHRIQDENSPISQEFRKKIKAQAAELEKQIPGLNLNNEKA